MVTGTTATSTVGHRLIVGEEVLAAASVAATGGRLSANVEVTNDGWVPKVFRLGESALVVAIPVPKPPVRLTPGRASTMAMNIDTPHTVLATTVTEGPERVSSVLVVA